MTVLISLPQLVNTLAGLTTETCAYLNRQTGHISILREEDIEKIAQEAGLAQEAQPGGAGSPKESIARWEARQVLGSPDYLRLPDKLEFDDHSLMELYCYQVEDREISTQLNSTLRGRGALRRFNEALQRLDMQADWEVFRREALAERAEAWLKTHDIPFTREVAPQELSGLRLPNVIIHTGMSLDGRLDWYTGDQGLYYQLAAEFRAEATLCGSATILATEFPEWPQEELDSAAPPEGMLDERTLLVIVDSRGQIKNWEQIVRQPYWRGVLVLCSHTTPEAAVEAIHAAGAQILRAGEQQVNLASALAELRQAYGIRTLRVDSGGLLNGALLRAGLVDEVSVLIHPSLVGGSSPRSLFVAPDLAGYDGVIPLKLIKMKRLGGGSVWLRYEVLMD